MTHSLKQDQRRGVSDLQGEDLNLVHPPRPDRQFELLTDASLNDDIAGTHPLGTIHLVMNFDARDRRVIEHQVVDLPEMTGYEVMTSNPFHHSLLRIDSVWFNPIPSYLLSKVEFE